MKIKVKIVLMLICMSISAIFCTNTFAVTKNDIINYVNSQSVCGDVGLFNSYKTSFTRLLKQKRLTQAELSTIYSYLESSVGVLNSKGVCKIADLNKLTSSEKKSVYNNLTAGAGIITSAPLLEFGEKDEVFEDKIDKNDESVENKEIIKDNEQGTKVTINSQDNTMDVYENGVLVDKISMSTQKLTYTGPNVIHMIIVISAVLVFILALSLFIKLYKKHTAKTRFVKNILVSLMICSGILAFAVGIFSEKIESLTGMIKLMSFNSTKAEIKVQLNEDKSIKTYPSYASNYATLEIPSVNIQNKVYFGDIFSILSMGIGHSTWSDMPTENGVVVYSGHNRKEMLANIKDIEKGDKIKVDTSYATCVYEVVKTDIIKDTESDKLTKLEDKETLIIYTCYPFDTTVYTNKRFVVYSKLDKVSWK